MRTCPYCESQISDTAKKCRHCGEWMPSEAPPAAVAGPEQKKVTPELKEAPPEIRASPAATAPAPRKGSAVFALVTFIFYLLMYPVGLLLNLVGLITGPRRGIFAALFVFCFLLPVGALVAILATGTALGVEFVDAEIGKAREFATRYIPRIVASSRSREPASVRTPSQPQPNGYYGGAEQTRATRQPRPDAVGSGDGRTFWANFSTLNLSEWEVVGGEWQADGGFLTGSWPKYAAQTDQANLLLRGQDLSADYDATVVAKLVDGSHQISLYQSPGNRYSINLDPGNLQVTRRTDGGQYAVVVERPPATVPGEGQQSRIVLSRRGQNFFVSLNGARVLEFSDPLFGGRLRLGLGVYGSATFDGFSYTPIDSRY